MLIFNKALEEPKYSSMYAKLCGKISKSVKNFESENPDIRGPHDNTFCKYLLAKCQHEFNNRLQASEAFGDGPLSEEGEERRDQAKKMMLGNIKFICELGKQNLADEGILHRCIVQLCKKKNNFKHTVEDFECLCQIMKTVGNLLDTERGKSLMDQYFSRMEKYANGNELPLRIKFKIQDVLDLRKNKWVPRTLDQNPRTLVQIRNEANKNYCFLQPGGSVMGSFSMNSFGNAGVPLNVRGSSNYGQQNNPTVYQVSGQRALDDLYGTNLPSYGNTSNSNSASNSMNSSFETKYENAAKFDNTNPNNYGNNRDNNYQPNQQPRRIINNQPPFVNKNYPNKVNDMSSSSSNSSLRGDDEQMNQRNQQQNYNNNSRNLQKDQTPIGPQQQQYRPNNNYHDSRPNNYNPNNNRYNNNANYQNNNYQNRNNSGERNLNNKMGNMNIRDQSNRNTELPPRFQKMQQQQQSNPQQLPPPQSNQYQPQNRNYNQDYSNPQQLNRGNQQPHYNNNYNNQNNQFNHQQQQQQPNQYQQRQNYSNNNYNNNMNNQLNQSANYHSNTINPKLINPVSNLANLNSIDSKEISLRPAKNFFSMKPPNLGSPGLRNENVSDQVEMNRNSMKQLNTPLNETGKVAPLTVQSVQQKIEQQKKDQKEEYLNKVNESLGKLIEKEIEEQEAINKIKELKTNKVSKTELLIHIMKYGLNKSEQERESIIKFFTKFKIDDYCTKDDYLNAFKKTLSAMRDLEVDVPKVKSFVAVYIAHGVKDEIIDLKEAFDLTVKTVYYPLFLLCLQYLGQNPDDQALLIKKFNESKLDLMLALPEIDRNKERLSEVLRDRQLGFLYPLLRIESELMKQVNSGNDILPKSLYTWIKENVDTELQKSEGFIITLFTCLVKYVTEKTKDSIEIEKEEIRTVIEVQEEVLSKYAKILQSFLLEKPNLQLALLYALQTYCHKLGFPKDMMLHWFIMLYNLEIVDNEVFLKWKEEVNDDYPEKGKALFQVNTWLNWLKNVEEDDDDEDDE